MQKKTLRPMNTETADLLPLRHFSFRSAAQAACAACPGAAKDSLPPQSPQRPPPCHHCSSDTRAVRLSGARPVPDALPCPGRRSAPWRTRPALAMPPEVSQRLPPPRSARHSVSINKFYLSKRTAFSVCAFSADSARKESRKQVGC